MGSFFTGLLGGFSQSMQLSLQRRQEAELRTQQQETNILNHLAQSSDDPEIRALALSGLMEMSQGKKRGGFLGLGRLKTTPSFQKLMELGQRAGIMPGAGSPPSAPGTAPAAVAAPPLGAEVDESGQPLAGGGQVVNRQVGEASPLAGLVSGAAQPSAALPTTSPTTGGPPPAPGLAAVGSPDIFGVRGPIGAQDALSIIRGRETERQAAGFEAQRRLEAQRQLGRESIADKRAAEQIAREEANWEHRDAQLATRMQAMADRTDKIITGAMERLGTSISARERQQQETSFRISKQRLSDELEKINRGRVRLHTQVMTPKERQAAQDDLDSAYDDAYNSFYREIGKERPKLGEEPRPVAAPAAPARPAVARPSAVGPPLPGAPPAAPASAVATIAPPGGAAAAGPPGPPQSLDQVPNGPQIRTQAEALRRQKKTPQQILELAAPHLNPLQLAALKSYLRL